MCCREWQQHKDCSKMKCHLKLKSIQLPLTSTCFGYHEQYISGYVRCKSRSTYQHASRIVIKPRRIWPQIETRLKLKFSSDVDRSIQHESVETCRVFQSQTVENLHGWRINLCCWPNGDVTLRNKRPVHNQSTLIIISKLAIQAQSERRRTGNF